MIAGKKIAVLGVIFLGLLAFVYFHEIRGKGEADKQQSEAKKVVQFNADKVRKIALSRRNESPTVAVKEGAKWRIIEPVQAVADSTAVDALLQSLADMSSDRTLEKVDLGKYGLKSPSVTVTLEEPGKKLVLYFGDKDFSGSNVYLTLDNAKVEIVPDAAYTKAMAPVSELRDKTILDFNADAIDRIEIHRQGDVVELKKQKDGWRLARPVPDQADDATVDSLVNSIRYGRIQDFAADSLDQLKKYGLQPPALQIVVFAGEKRSELNVGGKSGDNNYAYAAGRTVVFTVPKDVLEKATQPAEKLLSREVLKFERDKVNKIEATTEKGKWSVARKGNRWSVTEPAGNEKKNFQDSRVLFALETLRGDRAKNPGALVKPTLVYTLTLSDSTIRVEIFKKGKDWLARSSQSDKVFQVPEDKVETLNKSIESFLE
jgi:hypothetical protein